MPLEEEASKNKIINFFYSNAKEEDWLDGLDLYQLGRIDRIAEYEGLFSAQVSSYEGKGFEVRLRVRSTSVSGVLQWAECNCQKNRKSGLYCEHIIALVLQLNKNYPSLFENLASISPIAENFKHSAQDSKEKNQKSSINTKAAHTLLDRIKSKIKKISFKGNGLFEIEMSAHLGGASSHILDLDTLASYIENISEEKKTPLQAKNMTFYKESVWIGLHIYENKKKRRACSREELLFS